MPHSTTSEHRDNKEASWTTRLIGLTLVFAYVIVVHWVWGWSEIFNQWRNWSIPELFAVLLLILVTYLIRAIRIWDYFRRDPGVKLLNCLKLTLLHNLANNLLPMRSGEASFPLLMRSYFGLAMSRTTGTLLWFRFLDFLVILLLGAAIWMFWVKVNTLYWIIWLIALCSPVLAVSVQGLLLNGLINRLPQGKMQRLAQSLLSGMPQDMPPLLRSLALTWANWSLKLSLFALIILVFTDLNTLDALADAYTEAGMGAKFNAVDQQRQDLQAALKADADAAASLIPDSK